MAGYFKGGTVSLDPFQSPKEAPTVAGSHQYDVHDKYITILFFSLEHIFNF
jgi:hypothetical protein